MGSVPMMAGSTPAVAQLAMRGQSATGGFIFMHQHEGGRAVIEARGIAACLGPGRKPEL